MACINFTLCCPPPNPGACLVFAVHSHERAFRYFLSFLVHQSLPFTVLTIMQLFEHCGGRDAKCVPTHVQYCRRACSLCVCIVCVYVCVRGVCACVCAYSTCMYMCVDVCVCTCAYIHMYVNVSVCKGQYYMPHPLSIFTLVCSSTYDTEQSGQCYPLVRLLKACEVDHTFSHLPLSSLVCLADRDNAPDC